MKKCSYCGKEYGDDVSVCPDDGVQLQSPGAAPVRPASSGSGHHTGLAVTSLVLGILAYVLCLFPFAAIPAIICGHIASSRAKRDPAQFGGRKMSTAGLILGYANILIFVIIGALLISLAPAFKKVKGKAENAICALNLENVDIAMRQWAENHNGMLPTNLVDLTNDLNSPNSLICPSDPNHHRTGSRVVTVWDPDNVSYKLLTPGAALSNVENQVIIRCPIHGIEVLGDGTLKGTDLSFPLPSKK